MLARSHHVLKSFQDGMTNYDTKYTNTESNASGSVRDVTAFSHTSAHLRNIRALWTKAGGEVCHMQRAQTLTVVEVVRLLGGDLISFF